MIDVTNDDVQLLPEPDKVQAIANWQEPTTNTQLQSFIGAVNYYAKMIDGYSEMAANLTDIMNVTWKGESKNEHWTAEHTNGFLKLRAALMSAPILTLPAPDRPFILQADASNIALGGVIHQLRDDGQRVVVTYFSHKFSKAEQNWPVHERELFGLIFALRKFRYLLYGAEVTYEGDHKPLVWKGNRNCFLQDKSVG